jgi:hypothetical protein
VVNINADQLYLPGLEPSSDPVKDDDRSTWLLLFHVGQHELRAELSLPVDMNEEGYITAWQQRIILPSQPLDPQPAVLAPEFGPDIDIAIKRRV